MFTVKSLSNKLHEHLRKRNFNYIWKAKIPPTFQIWLWLIWHNAIATKDNMKKTSWQGEFNCRFCDEPETIHHLIFTCSVAKYMWSIVSKILGAYNRPENFLQYFTWIARF
jgi:hypothetical protein